MTLPRSLQWIGGVLLTLIVLIILVGAFFDWNGLRDPIARRVSSSTGRSFAINGDLNVHLSLRPRVVANDIVVGNAAWGREPHDGHAQAPRIQHRPIEVAGRQSGISGDSLIRTARCV
jgi:uncharacterized protein involved in outer membrane biogenesis